MSVLLTGGLGYIGSHIAYFLKKKSIIIDNFSNTNLNYKATLPFAKVYKCSLNQKNLEKIFTENKIDSVIHLASLKSVFNSIKQPLDYYDNNVNSSLILLKTMDKFNIRKLIFSSSATVYGANNNNPLSESSTLNAMNPYGNTKIIIEKMISDYANSNAKFKSISLRYFNPVGANISAGLSDKPLGDATNLMPAILEAVSKNKKLTIFGKDYDTKDGTCIRDYIHVNDLAIAHIKALKNLKIGHKAINVGLGKGMSVLDLIKIFERVNKVSVPRKFGKRRKGDVAISFASNQLATKLLNWRPKYSYQQMCSDSWEAFKN